MDNKEQFVRASLQGDAVQATQVFHELMLDKISSSIDSVRTVSAQTIFNSGVNDGSSTSNES